VFGGTPNTAGETPALPQNCKASSSSSENCQESEIIMPGLRYRLMMKYQRLRILKYRCLSTCEHVIGTPIVNQPVQYVGKGTIKFIGKVTLGVYPSPYFLGGYIYLEARYPDSIIEIGDGVWFNNNVALISAGPGIFIGFAYPVDSRSVIFSYPTGIL
jgi:hypothetical protein